MRLARIEPTSSVFESDVSTTTLPSFVPTMSCRTKTVAHHEGCLVFFILYIGLYTHNNLLHIIKVAWCFLSRIQVFIHTRICLTSTSSSSFPLEQSIFEKLLDIIVVNHYICDRSKSRVYSTFLQACLLSKRTCFCRASFFLLHT